MNDNRSTASLHSGLHTERHYTPAELGELWGLSSDTIRRLFEDEPGVLMMGERHPPRKRRYLTLRIPSSVAARVHRRMSAGWGSIVFGSVTGVLAHHLSLIRLRT
jgi:hypothetical protein